MAILSEIKKEILDNRELNSEEKICLIVFLCSPTIRSLDQLATQMGTTRNMAQMVVRSLRMKGYMKDAEVENNEEEIQALKKLLARENLNEGERLIKAERVVFDNAQESVGITSDDGQKPNVYPRAVREQPIERRFDEPVESPSENAFVNRERVDAEIQPEASHNVSKKSSGGTMQRRVAALYKNDAQKHQKAKKKSESASPVSSDTVHKEDRVMQMIDETLTRQEASIILGFAGGDLDKVEAAYKRVKGTQIKDKIDALVKLLQAD